MRLHTIKVLNWNKFLRKIHTNIRCANKLKYDIGGMIFFMDANQTIQAITIYIYSNLTGHNTWRVLLHDYVYFFLFWLFNFWIRASLDESHNFSFLFVLIFKHTTTLHHTVIENKIDENDGKIVKCMQNRPFNRLPIKMNISMFLLWFSTDHFFPR